MLKYIYILKKATEPFPIYHCWSPCLRFWGYCWWEKPESSKFFVQDFNHQQHHLECTYLKMQNYSIFGSFFGMNGILFHWHSGTQDASDSGKRWLVFHKCHEAILDFLHKRAWLGGLVHLPDVIRGYRIPPILRPEHWLSQTHSLLLSLLFWAAPPLCRPPVAADPNSEGPAGGFQPTSTPPVHVYRCSLWYLPWPLKSIFGYI